MAARVKWAFPDREQDDSVHFLYNNEWTLCGLAFEGVGGSIGRLHSEMQGFIGTEDKVDCSECISRVKLCKSIKSSEYTI